MYCGPVLDELLDVRTAYQDRITFVHVDIYKSLRGTVQSPTVRAWKLPTEPWLFTVDGAGTIVITTRRASTGIAVEIEDDGPGVPGELQSRIFDPFFTTKAVGAGSGLGLDIARRIVRGHRGDITLSSRPGSTSFTVLLPLDDPAG